MGPALVTSVVEMGTVPHISHEPPVTVSRAHVIRRPPLTIRPIFLFHRVSPTSSTMPFVPFCCATLMASNGSVECILRLRFRQFTFWCLWKWNTFGVFGFAWQSHSNCPVRTTLVVAGHVSYTRALGRHVLQDSTNANTFLVPVHGPCVCSCPPDGRARVPVVDCVSWLRIFLLKTFGTRKLAIALGQVLASVASLPPATVLRVIGSVGFTQSHGANVTLQGPCLTRSHMCVKS
mmetsp:Transcript_5251/g.14894  ORF Transcript_5251/g.14894 Transcript_5251/m.14894 type:complete len:234 (-) Transcript_5251:530-1231(-)